MSVVAWSTKFGPRMLTASSNRATQSAHSSKIAMELVTKGAENDVPHNGEYPPLPSGRLGQVVPDPTLKLVDPGAESNGKIRPSSVGPVPELGCVRLL